MNDFFNKIFPYPENVPSDDCEFFFNDNQSLKNQCKAFLEKRSDNNVSSSTIEYNNNNIWLLYLCFFELCFILVRLFFL